MRQAMQLQVCAFQVLEHADLSDKLGRLRSDDVRPEDLAAHPDFDITTVQDALEDEVKPLIERIDGVAEVNLFGGREREARVLVDPAALAQRPQRLHGG